MATKLTIDEGNSSVKVALWHDNVMDAPLTLHNVGPDQLRAVAGGCQVDSAIFCSVRRRTAARVADIVGDTARRTLLLGPDTPLPITVDYRTPQTLGPDRVAAAVGATVVAPGHTLLVVDLGTAITYDVVTADGRFLGGNIAPGIFMRLEALHHFTSALPAVETDGDVPRWGYDTETALRSGAVRGVVGELQYYRHCMPRSERNGVILTGGAASIITPHISTPITEEPNLVLIGLNRILDYNESL